MRGQDEVGGPVDDAENPFDRLAGQGLRQRPDDRDPATDGGFEEEGDAGAFGGGDQFRATRRNEFLVRRHDRFAGLERGEHQIAGEVVSTHELHHEVDLRVVDDAGAIVGEDAVCDDEVAWLVEVPNGDAPHDEVEARLGHDGVPIVNETRDEGSSNRSRTEDSDADRCVHTGTIDR